MNINMIFHMELSDSDTLTDKYVDNIFFKQDDKIVLIDMQIYNDDIKTFFQELRQHFNNVWLEKFKINDEITSFSELNKTLGNYPSHIGHSYLSDSFISEYKLSSTSKKLLDYFYGINLL